MSSNSRSNSTFTGRLSALANRLRLGAARSDGRELRERAAALELPNVRGLVVGRSLLYPGNDAVEAAVDAAVALL